jgi:hypothetical protein
MSGDIPEVRQSVRAARDAITIVLDGQVWLTVLPPPRDDNGLGMRVDTVLDELRYCLQRIRLGERNDAYGIPIIANP